MNIKRNVRIAAVTAIACAGISSPAMALTPMTTIGAPAPKPHVMTHAEWKHCWTITYAQWRDSGSSIQNSATAADWTCGDPPL
jgi:hypothetical protein